MVKNDLYKTNWEIPKPEETVKNFLNFVKKVYEDRKVLTRVCKINIVSEEEEK